MKYWNKVSLLYLLIAWLACFAPISLVSADSNSHEMISPRKHENRFADFHSKQIVTVVTPYPDKLIATFQQAFEEDNPDIELRFIADKGTSSAVRYIQNQQNNGVADLFWASSGAAFDTLKQQGLLQSYRPEVPGIPAMVSGVPLHDANHNYSGFALAGYGYMWNERYLKAWRLPYPKRWKDLTQAHFHGHLAMSTPGLSGTTHTIVESILQAGKWQERWYLLKRIAGNLKRLEPESYAVALGVRDGEYAIGAAVDYYGLSMQAERHPVRFIYPERPMLSAAYIALLKRAPNPDAAKRFIDYLFSKNGQMLLLDKHVSRLPVRADTYRQAPEGFPNPFDDRLFQQSRIPDTAQIRQRYELVNVVFDKLITFNFNELKAATKQIQCLELALLTEKHPESEQLLSLAIQAFGWVPFDEIWLEDGDYLRAFEQDALPSWDDKTVQEEGIAYQPERWSQQAWVYYKQAAELATQGMKLLNKECR